MERLLGRLWHQLSVEETASILDTDEDNGLDRFAIERRRERFGPNALTAAKETHVLVRFLLQFHQPLIHILIVAGIVTLALGEYIDAGVIFGVVLINGVMGYVQEDKAYKALGALARSMTTMAVAVRGGEQITLPAEELVPGDVVLLTSGDKVPADLRLLSAKQLRTDESALTGESLPVDKAEAALEKDTPLAERSNMAFASTLVTSGRGRGVVTATGNYTEIGLISGLVAKTGDIQTPLTKKIAGFSTMLMWVIGAMSAATFALGLLRGEPVTDMFMAAVALAVGAIPEGLPAAVTVILAMGVSRMARRRAIIRKLPAVETLGSTTVICSDKTGTLTRNEMTVQRIAAGGGLYEVSGGGYAPEGEIIPEEGAPSLENEALAQCLLAGVLCNDSAVVGEPGERKAEGDPTEAALLVAAEKFGLNPRDERSARRRLDAIPFESERQFMAVLVSSPQGERRVFAKGGVEAVLPLCGQAMGPDGTPVTLDKSSVLRMADGLALDGLRVLALAGAPTNQEGFADNAPPQDLIFLGLQAMIDPPRPEAIAAVQACQRAGIRVKMITGDHAVTAVAVAREMGLHLDFCGRGEDGDCRGVTGAQMMELTDDELVETADSISVFARVSPQQKLRLVQALQARGHVVSMTGDGVNDAPALKKADIGVAMGKGGTDAAREAADMVLTDDDFASIEAAVEEGRGVFDNLIKFIVWTLPTNIGEGLVILAAIAMGALLPILPVQILWINMTTAGFLGLMLAFEPKEKGIMNRPPRDVRAPILGPAMVVRVLLVGLILLGTSFGLFRWVLASGASLAQARTVAVNVFVMVEAAYLFNCRSLRHPFFHPALGRNHWVTVGAASMVATQMAFTYVPVMNTLFKSAPIDGLCWLLILGTALAAHLVVEIEKWLGAKLRSRSGNI